MIVTTLTAAAVLSLAACSSNGGSTDAAAPSQAASAPAAAPTDGAGAASAAPSTTAGDPAAAASKAAAATAAAGDKAKELALVGGLGQINPKLAQDQQASLAAAAQTCADLKAGKDPETVAKNTTRYFSANGTTVTEQQGQMITVLVKAALCP